MDISVQACKEEFLTNHPGQNVLEKSLADNPFVTTGNVEKGKWCTWQYMSLKLLASIQSNKWTKAPP
jgi:hypothetical protein